MFKKISICIILIALMLSNTPGFSFAADKELRFPLPNLSPLNNNDQCRCEAIVTAGIYGNTIQNKEILGELSNGTDKISIRIEGNVLFFLSGASFEIGEAKAAQFNIIFESNEGVMAIFPEKTAVGYTIDIFTLNRKTGMAVWTKTRSSDLFSGGTPSAQSFYLKCK